MNRALIIAAFAMGTLSLVVSLFPREIPAPVSQSATVSAQVSDELELMDRRIAALEDANHDLYDRLQRLQRASTAVLSAGDGGSAVDVSGANSALALELEQLRGEVRGLVAGEALNSEGGKTYLKEQLREVMADEQRARMERFANRPELDPVAQREVWKKFVTDAKLNYAQEQTMMKALEAETEKRKALRDAATAAGKSFDEVFREQRELRRETDHTVKAELDATQQKQYDEMRRSQNRGGGPGFGQGGGNRRNGTQP